MIELQDDKKIELIVETFPILLLDDIDKEHEQKTIYNHIAVSIFDHWLTEEEAEKDILSYPVLMERAPDRLQEYYIQEEKFLNFLSQLYHRFNIFNVIENDSEDEKTSQEKFYIFESYDEYLAICKDSLREKEFVLLCIPEQKVLFIGNYDLTNIIYYSKDANITETLNIIHDSNLFILLDR